jgi:tellurite resistance protein TerC
MATWWSWMQTPEFLVLVGFHVFVLAMLALDLGVFQRHAHTVSMKEAAIWSAVWIGLAMVFAVCIWKFWGVWHPEQPHEGTDKAIEFVTGYLIEKSLSVDNLFVFLVIFRYFAVPKHLQHRILFWGILGALIMRATLILAGAALLATFSWMIYIFGAFLLYTSYKLFTSVEEEIDPGKNPVLRLATRLFPVINHYEHSHRFWVKRDGIWHATPLPLVLLVVESTDVVFAIDSIPAIFGITRDTFIVYTSNIFAILGLRALYFLLAGFLGMFRYLSVGLALVLGFVGLKMILEPSLHSFFEEHGISERMLIVMSLGVIALILTGAVVASIIAGPKEPLEHPPEGESDTPPPGVTDNGSETPSGTGHFTPPTPQP